jgi:hypothetical protein
LALGGTIKVGSTFTYSGVALLLSYAAAFYWVFHSAGSEQSQKYTITFSDRKKINLVGVALLGGAFLISNLILATILFVAAIGWIVHATYTQRKQMEAGRFDEIFTMRLFRISFMSIAAIGFLYAGKSWNA